MGVTSLEVLPRLLCARWRKSPWALQEAMRSPLSVREPWVWAVSQGIQRGLEARPRGGAHLAGQLGGV
eukprot:3914057-Pyramimonas_sp.AAC.1